MARAASEVAELEASQFMSGDVNTRAAIYGRMDQGNLILGNSVQGTNRDWRGTTNPTNAVKLLNGTIGSGANTTGGGYFYVNAGALHWVGSAGTDTTIAAA